MIGLAGIAGKRRLVLGLVGLALLRIDDDVVDKTSRHADISRVDGALFHQPPDHRNRNSPIGPGCLCHRAVVPEPGFIVHSKIPGRVRLPGMNQCHVDGDGWVEQVLLAVADQ